MTDDEEIGPEGPSVPFPIFQVSASIERYMLYDIDIVSWLRQRHHLLGVLSGTLPQIPQQNVFLGLPVQLMPEEARWLVEAGIAFIVSDREWHEQTLAHISESQVHDYTEALAREGREAARQSLREKQDRSAKAQQRQAAKTSLQRQTTAQESILPDGAQERTQTVDGVTETVAALQTPEGLRDESTEKSAADPEESLFTPETQAPLPPRPASDPTALEPWSIIPTTATAMLGQPLPSTDLPLPSVSPSSYALFKHLHKNGYFLSPGLRFGCQYMAYPGDPLRFHSHFLAVGKDWEEEFDLLDVVGGGRLGTGVKKAFLLGGPSPSDDDEVAGPVRTFCVEWGGM